MKVKLVGNTIAGFSTLEIVIALALMITVIVGAVNANIASQYWSMTSETSNEALYKAKTVIEELRAFSSADFQSASSTGIKRSEKVGDPADDICIGGGLCYFTKSTVVDISSCSKYVTAEVSWRLGLRYATSSVKLYTNLTNNEEIIAKGGDCALNEPEGEWLSSVPSESGSLTLSSAFTTGIDVLQKKVYLTSSSTPQLRIYTAPTTSGTNPTLLGSTQGKNRRLNAVDAFRDLSTGRTYAYAMQHASTSQLAVFDVTDASAPVFVTEKTLSGVDKTGSFPQGWKIALYGNRLYVTTRETTGPEIHIFNINAPTSPSEIGSASIEHNGTINDLVVREQMVGGVLHRYLFVVSSATTKELMVYDVTGDTPSEVVTVNLSNDEDAQSLFLTGNSLYVGRKNASGPELHLFDVQELLNGVTTPKATAEVGADVTTLMGAGEMLFVGTSKNGEEFQVWNSDPSTWNPSVANAGRATSQSFSRLAPLGIDFSMNFVYLQSQSASVPEMLKVLHIP